ncbi:MAG: copper amine oxidase N-terminal domain-containing protein [Capsulimonadales bacterium]|nr:copper amine oxidase N-terminal domain-containing protein [Capsulimonadales bacterium]
MTKPRVSTVSVAVWIGSAVFLAVPAVGQESAIPAAPPTAQVVTEPAIGVRVNGEQIPFAGQGPVRRGNAILVPLRGIFEKLGATVKFEAGTITANRSGTKIMLRVGDANATVNGSVRTLASVPESVNGSVLVPLRFVSEALGAQVTFDPRLQVVEVVTDAIVAEKLPTPPANVAAVNGTVTGIFPEADAITVRVGSGENRRLPLAPGAFVQIRSGKRVVREASINSLRSGDQVRVLRNAQGLATVIEFANDERRGIIKAKEQLANGNTLVRLTNGTSVEVLGSAPVRQAASDISLTDIKPGETVVIRVNPETGIGIGVAAVTGDDTDPVPPEPEPAAGNGETPPASGTVTPPSPVPKAEPAAATNAPINAPMPADTSAPADPAGKPSEQKPQIDSLTHDAADKILKGGETVTVTVVGAPKGTVTLSMPALFGSTGLPAPEKEDTPGTYVATFTTPFNTTAPEVALTAVMKIGEESSPEVKAEKPLSIDGAGPELSLLEPKENEATSSPRPRIAGSFKDVGSKVDPKSARLYLNDEEVTEKATFTETGFSLEPPTDLKEGPVKVALSVKDALGNETSQSWTFTIKPPVKPIRKVTVAPTGNTLRANDILTVRMDGMPGGKATFRIETLEDQPMTEESEGVYVGRYSVKRGDTVSKARVYVTFVPPGSEDKLLREAPETVTLRAVPPAAPVVKEPKTGEAIKSPVLFSGTTEPYNTIRLSFSFEGKQFLSKAKGTFPSVEIKADENGNWKTEAVALDLPRGISGVTFTVDVVAISVTDEVSPVTTLKLKKK